MSDRVLRLRLTDDDAPLRPAKEWDVALQPKEESRLRWALQQPAEILLGTLVELDMPRDDSVFNEVYDAAESCGVPVLEVRDEFESKPKMPEEEFRKWFNMLWNRLWSDAPREETVGEMWACLVSQGFPKDAFYDECRRRGIIIGGERA